MMEVLKIDEWLSDKPNKQFVYENRIGEISILRLKDSKRFKWGDTVRLFGDSKFYIFLDGYTDLIRVCLIDDPFSKECFFKEDNDLV
jgi:hypothetical protein